MLRRILTLSAVAATAVTAFGACSHKQTREPRFTPASRIIPDTETQPGQPESLGSTGTNRPSDMGSDTSATDIPSGSGAQGTWGADSSSDVNAGTTGGNPSGGSMTGGSTGDMNTAIPGGTSGSVSGGVGEPSSFAISRARCDREIRCKNVGISKKYATREDCVRDLNKSDSDSFGSNVCANGVDQDQLNRCVAAIRNESCKSSLDKLDTLNACQATKVCKR